MDRRCLSQGSPVNQHEIGCTNMYNVSSWFPFDFKSSYLSENSVYNLQMVHGYPNLAPQKATLKACLLLSTA